MWSMTRSVISILLLILYQGPEFLECQVLINDFSLSWGIEVLESGHVNYIKFFEITPNLRWTPSVLRFLPWVLRVGDQ